MDMKTGEIRTAEELEKIYGKAQTAEDAMRAKAKSLEDLCRATGHTPLTDDEHATIEPLNRHERRAALAKLRREARQKKETA